jgi:pyruvate dehydrogenase E1 component alpha subunit
VPATAVDGNDVLAVESAAAELVASVRAGQGPRFLHARTYRIGGHTGADPATYRPQGEVEAQKANDPIPRAREWLILAGVAEAELDADRRAAFDEMEAAYASARAAPFPSMTVAFEDVQDIGAPGEGPFG